VELAAGERDVGRLVDVRADEVRDGRILAESAKLAV
jgi:hypothetical protein